MKQIIGLNQAIKKVGEFSINELNKVNEIKISTVKDGDLSHQEIVLMLETENRKMNFSLKIRFINVANLKLDKLGSTEIRIDGFEIYDISDRNWEKLSWEVNDYENSMINFYCSDVEILDVIEII